jgi:hypothetical protein
MDWVGKNTDKNFEDYQRTICVTDADVPKQTNATVSSKPKFVVPEVKPVSKKKVRLTKAQWSGIIAGSVAMVIFSYLGRQTADYVREKWEMNKVQMMDFPVSDTSSWKTFNDSDANYSILFPGEPNENSQTVETEIGNLEVKQYIFEPKLGKDANILYGTGYTVYPAQYIDNRSMDEEQLAEFFRNSVNGTVANVQGRLLSTHIIDYKGYPGREIKIDIKDGLAVVKMRSYLIQNKMYILQVISPAKNTFNKSINYFLDSFVWKE